MNIVIIVPTYNEAGNIKKTLLLLQKMIAGVKHHHFRILVLDSHSTDQTPSIVKSLQKKFKNTLLICEESKSGLGAAYVYAMQYVMQHLNADVIFEFDADGSHQPQYIPLMIKTIENGADVVMGSRYIKGGKINADWKLHRHLISRVGNWIARFFLTTKFKDLTTGFRATKVSFLKQIQLENLISKNYAYKLHLFWELYQLGANMIEIPIQFVDRQHGKSKFPRNNIFESLKVVIILRLRSIFQKVGSFEFVKQK